MGKAPMPPAKKASPPKYNVGRSREQSSFAPMTSQRPMPRDMAKSPAKSDLAPTTSKRPMPNPKHEERAVPKMKSGGMVEGSAKDMREDKAMAKKAGLSMAKWEKSAADKKHDAPKKMAGGGMCGTKKMVTGGTVARGMGAAKRGGAFGKNG